MEKPRIIMGICEFCGVPAETCQHYRKDIPQNTIPEYKPVEEKKPKYSIDYRIADIVIPHHNRHDHLKDCLDKLPNNIFNIIIVSGGTFAENCNKGAKLAVTDNIIVMNDDIIPDVDLLIESCLMSDDIVGFYQEVPEKGLRTGIRYAVNRLGLTACMSEGYDDLSLPAGHLLRVKREAWEKLGGFNEIFRNGCEDHDLPLRALKEGMTIGYVRKPVFHKHSQSQGRFDHCTENVAKLKEIWSDEDIVNTIGLNKRRLRILITNNHLKILGGTETWVYTMARTLERMGHFVDVYARTTGMFDSQLKMVETPASEYDLILINHNTCLEDVKNIKGFKVFTSHSKFYEIEDPREGADKYVAISEATAKHFKLDNVILNPVDIKRFYPKKPINKKLTKVLSLAKGEEANEIIQKACDKLGVKLEICSQTINLEEKMNEADLVISLGRGAYEALSCGRAVIVFDTRGYMGKNYGDGYVTTDNIGEFIKHNLSGRASQKKFTVKTLVDELKKYNHKDGGKNRQWAVENLDSEKIAQKYIDLWQEKSFRFINSSETDYGIAKHLERELIEQGWQSGNKYLLTYANDIGETTHDGQEMSLDWFPMRRAVFSRADYVFYSQKVCERFFRRPNCYYLPSGINDKVFNDLKLERDIDIGFVGNNANQPREEFLSIMDGIDGFVHNNGIFFEEVAEFYNKCKIVANHSVANEIVMRMFEATACGALLITKRVPHLEEFWELGKEIVVYDTYDEMKEKIDYYLENKKEREQIAKAGQKRTLKDHTYKKRVKEIERIICSDGQEKEPSLIR